MTGQQLKFLWRPVSQSRVQPFPVVYRANEFTDTGVGIAQIPILGSVHLLVFECFHKSFRDGIGLGRQLRLMQAR